MYLKLRAILIFINTWNYVLYQYNYWYIGILNNSVKKIFGQYLKCVAKKNSINTYFDIKSYTLIILHFICFWDNYNSFWS